MNKEFIRVHSTKDIAISLILVISGIILVALPASASVNISGSFMLIAGIFLFLMLKSGYKETGTGERYCRKERFFPQSCRDNIMSAIAMAPESIDLNEEDKGNGLKIEVFYNKKNNKAFISLHEYIPYKYEQCSPTFEYTAEQVSKLLD